MGKNVATLEFEFYIKLLKRHTKELFLLINEKNVLILSIFLKPHINVIWKTIIANRVNMYRGVKYKCTRAFEFAEG